MSHKSTKNTIHFVGIGGIGMSALARLFLTQNWNISGSDMSLSKITLDITKEGANVKIGHKKSNIPPKTAFVVHSQAISPQNPELKEANRLKIPIKTYPKALAEIIKNHEAIAVAGSHGKSTTSSLLSVILIKAGLDPSLIIGTDLKDIGNKNFRKGKGKHFIIEADEWKESFLNYTPSHLIITNIDKEHLDYYKNLNHIKKTFLELIKNVKPNGIVVLDKDDRNSLSLKSEIENVAKHKKLNIVWISENDKLLKIIEKNIRIPGKHNIKNALFAYALSKRLGVSDKIIIDALKSYKGIWRRMEYRGTQKFEIQSSNRRTKLEIKFYDDYAHHPTEIKATLSAFKEKFPKHKIICVFQPHQAHRLKNLFKEFTTAFTSADYLILFPVYKVAGRDKFHKGYTSKDLAKATPKTTKYLPSPNQLSRTIRKIVGGNYKNSANNHVVIMMGAGNIFEYTEKLIKPPQGGLKLNK